MFCFETIISSCFCDSLYLFVVKRRLFFNCRHCNKSHAGQRFTIRLLSQTDDNFSYKAFCLDCYGELFGKKCAACGHAITGVNGTRFITFEEKSWHTNCFQCDDCKTSLVGKGFITDKPDSMICEDCAKAKLT